MAASRKRKRRKPSLRQRISDYFRRREAIRAEKAKRRYKRKLARRHIKAEVKREKELYKSKIRTEKADHKSNSHSNFKSRLKTSSLNQFLNSLVIFILSYVIVYLVCQITIIFAAALWELDAVLYYFDLSFDDFSPKWSRLNIIFTTFSGPFICLIIGVLLYFWLLNLKLFQGYHRLFLLWLALHCFNRFLGALSSGIMTDEGFGYVINWMYMPIFFKILLALLALFFLAIIGYYNAGRFLETNLKGRKPSRIENLPFLIRKALLPWIAGSIILLLVRIPNNFNYPYETIMIFTMGLLVVPAVFNKNAVPRIWLMKDSIQRKSLHWVYMILLLAFLSFYRIELDRGLHFYVKMHFSVNVTKGK